MVNQSKIAVMQPYIFPYIGYFQLIKTADVFVFYNDVNFIVRGWINRNRILNNNNAYFFTIGCKKISQNKRICDTELYFKQKQKIKLLNTIYHNYSRAPFFEPVYNIFKETINSSVSYIDELAISSVKNICQFLSIKTVFKSSKNLYGNDDLKGPERLIDICLKEKKSEYINLIGAKNIYKKEYFIKRGIKLKFLKSNLCSYSQFKSPFVPMLSIIDVLMFNGSKKTKMLLSKYELI